MEAGYGCYLQRVEKIIVFLSGILNYRMQHKSALVICEAIAFT